MSFIGLRVPRETARVLWSFYQVEGFPGEPAPEDEAHITLVNLGDALPDVLFKRTSEATRRVTQRTRPFRVSTSRIATFPPGKTGTPIVARVDSEPLHELQGTLREALDEAGVPYSKKFPTFKPHVTLAYSSDPLVDELFGGGAGFSPLEWGAHEVTVWRGEKGLTGPSTYPLKIVSREASYRILVKRALSVHGGCSPR